MGWYDRYVLPHMLNCVCGIGPVRRQREKVVPRARGRVLEIGFGSGLNLPHYDAGEVERVWALEPAEEVFRLATTRIEAFARPVEYIPAGAEDIPLADGCADTVVVTYSLCTIPDPDAALAEMRRVLRPGGSLLYAEHGAAPDPSVRRWQDRINGGWRRIAGGCNVNRDVQAMLSRAGFSTDGMQTMYLPGWRPLTFNAWGEARV